MRRAVLLLPLLVGGCGPTYEDWSHENHAVFQGYMTGDVYTAKAALLEEEKLVAKHEAGGNPSVDFPAVRTVLYTELCGISQHLGQTNEARLYFQKYLESSSNKDMTFDGLLVAAKKGDDLLKPKWREQK
jgi:hypothetical protein